MSESATKRPGGRILLIEDHVATARGLRALLTSRGHRVDVVTGAEEAEARVSQRDYELVLTDLDLGCEGGVELVARLRGFRPKLAVLVVTARDRATVLGALGAESGVDCLEKPVAPDALVAAVEARVPLAAARLRRHHSS